ncbi:lasso peptide biosynthesis B2 protein [Methanobacterium sp. SMA-27]|uniref:lasso peptide biosynthesis B2 protein n=1 Tax=Methanobacterium sp. SMA-27 TaxID=1495336 RepID=UPI00064E15D1|nr:lasso peptide biosynthesis B2 protein [Methanobacterium sp. SMA-27]
MNKIHSFYKLSSEKKSLFIKSLILTIFIRLSLSLLSFSRGKKISKIFSIPPNNSKATSTIGDIIWSVRVVSPYIPRATCLTQAITGQILLSRYNHRSNLKIGVMKGDEFEAHAWLEIGDEIVLGESENEFVPILELDQ